jgi:bacterial/archaeal transporter family-2 protein
MGVVWSLLGIVSGMVIAVQGPINVQLARALGSPIAAAAVSFVAGTLVLAVITLATVPTPKASRSRGARRRRGCSSLAAASARSS